ncbi:hypothetical protein LEP1GSC127_1203 [Leptospira kirschneri str. 200801925]|nr:hypothetical protein LEP1GSC127_1203 [Leptospira kirschneri str. 200801925]
MIVIGWNFSFRLLSSTNIHSIFWYTPSVQFDRLDRLVDEVAFVDNLVIQEPNVGEAADDGEFEVTDTIKKRKILELQAHKTQSFPAQPLR